MADKQVVSSNEAEVRDMIEAWADAVRRKDYAGILRSHASDFVMFDVPPPFKSVGLEAYRKTWDLFFSWSSDPVPFDIQTLWPALTSPSLLRACDVRGPAPKASPRRSIFV